MWIVPPVAGLIEPAVAPEIFATKIGGIERIGNMLRFYLVAEQMPLDGGVAVAQKVVVAKVVQPIENLPMCFELLARCLTTPGAIEREPPDPPPRPHLVR